MVSGSSVGDGAHNGCGLGPGPVSVLLEPTGHYFEAHDGEPLSVQKVFSSLCVFSIFAHMRSFHRVVIAV